MAYEKAMTPSNIKAGFKKCGIFPFDCEVFTEDEFFVSYVTDRNREIEPSNIIEEDDREAATSTGSGVSLCYEQLESTIVNAPSEDQPTSSPHCSKTSRGFVSPHIFKGFPKAGERKGGRKARVKLSKN